MILGEILNQKRIRVRQCYSSNPEVTGFEYDATESPCERVIERKDCCYPAGVQALFPEHPLVRKLGAEGGGYIGVPLFDRDNNPMGLLTVLHDTPLKAPDIALPLCNLLALSISAELERIRAEQILRQSEQFFRKVAFIDQLTGLCNRLLLMRRLEHAMEGVRRYDHQLAVLFLDIDGFKQVNDIAGHDVGDQVLAGAAQRITISVGSTDTVARLGGDEFVILLEQRGNESGARTVAERALSAFSHPICTAGHCWSLSTSIGISLYERTCPETQALDLLKQADAAMYASKRSSPGHYRFSS